MKPITQTNTTLRFQFDIYTPLDSENSKGETTQKKWTSEKEFIDLLENIEWSNYPAPPTINVYEPNSNILLWVSLYATSDDNDEMFIVGYHRFVQFRTLLGFGKVKEKEKITTYFVVGRDGVKSVFSSYFQSHLNSMEKQLEKFNAELS